VRPRVFVIHGRDLDAVEELVRFLTGLGLEHVSFEDVAAEGTAPFIADVVISGIAAADVVIALFTPDEHAALYDPRTAAYIGESEGEARWQARPNVLFEAGVAMGVARNRTILATLGVDVALFSDVSGVHFVVLHRPAGKRLLYEKIRRLLPEAILNVSAVDDPEMGDFRRVLRTRWKYYDELTNLESHLAEVRLGRAGVSLRAILVKVVAPQPLNRLEKIAPTQLIKAIEDTFTASVADNAYWWLIVHGVLRFADTEHWFSGDHWTDSVENAEVTERGVALLKKLAIAPSTST
jgi:hypothetical protein